MLPGGGREPESFCGDEGDSIALTWEGQQLNLDLNKSVEVYHCLWIVLTVKLLK
jgi:hypothetical protein